MIIIELYDCEVGMRIYTQAEKSWCLRRNKMPQYCKEVPVGEKIFMI